jgi:hypothetical protein
MKEVPPNIHLLPWLLRIARIKEVLFPLLELWTLKRALAEGWFPLLLQMKLHSSSFLKITEVFLPVCLPKPVYETNKGSNSSAKPMEVERQDKGIIRTGNRKPASCNAALAVHQNYRVLGAPSTIRRGNALPNTKGSPEPPRSWTALA